MLLSKQEEAKILIIFRSDDKLATIVPPSQILLVSIALKNGSVSGTGPDDLLPSQLCERWVE
ncbi:hypothetical protein DXT96_26410 [Agrobacterium sp. ICMP 6402]|nr:hypothetical protein [Agrobacterium sp. ICMP 6402]